MYMLYQESDVQMKMHKQGLGTVTEKSNHTEISISQVRGSKLTPVVGRVRAGKYGSPTHETQLRNNNCSKGPSSTHTLFPSLQLYPLRCKKLMVDIATYRLQSQSSGDENVPSPGCCVTHRVPEMLNRMFVPFETAFRRAVDDCLLLAATAATVCLSCSFLSHLDTVHGEIMTRYVKKVSHISTRLLYFFP